MTQSAEVLLLCDAWCETKGSTRELDPSLLIGGVWRQGPLPIAYQGHGGLPLITDAKTRATNFPASLGPFLFGSEALSGGVVSPIRFETRFHALADDIGLSNDSLQRISSASEVQAHSFGITVGSVELILADTSNSIPGALARPAVVVAHVSVQAPDLDSIIAIVKTLSHSRGDKNRGYVRGVETHNLLEALGIIPETVRFPSKIEDGTEGSVYSVVLTDEGGEGELNEVDKDSLYRVAAMHKSDANHTHESRIATAMEGIRPLSKSWSMLALRHGAGFQLHCPKGDPYRKFAPIYFHSLYADAFMLAKLQDLILREWERSAIFMLSLVSDHSDLSNANSSLRQLDRSVTVDSSRYWLRRSVANTGNSISIVHDVQDALGLPVRLESVEAQISTLSRLSERDFVNRQTRAQEILSAVAMVFAVAVFPITIANDFVDVFRLNPSRPVVVICLVSIAIVLGLGAVLLRRAIFARRS